MTLNHTLVILWALIQPSPSPPSLPSSGSQPSGQDRNPLNFKASKLDADSVNGSCRREAPQPGLLSLLPGQLAPVLESPTKQKTKVCEHPRTLGEGVLARAPGVPPAAPAAPLHPALGQACSWHQSSHPPREMTELPCQGLNLGSGHCASWPCHSNSGACWEGPFPS